MGEKASSRLLALDILRGITIAGMILVNDPGSWSYIYVPLAHAGWHGLTPTDLIFPFFMFIMGISTYISLRKYNFEYSSDAARKILKRTIIIFLIGLGLNWLSLSLRTYNQLGSDEMSFLSRLGLSVTNFENIRIMGVMQRLALTYGITSILALLVKHKYFPYIIVSGLLGYFLLLFAGNGFDFSEESIVSVIDTTILGVNHMYRDSGVSIDPEGLISTLPAVFHVMIGFYCGKIMIEAQSIGEKIEKLFIWGTVMTFIGFLLSYGCPINKKIWTPTFVLATCGLASSLLALLIWIIDVKGYKSWTKFFESFGVNPLFIYVASQVIAILFDNIRFYFNGELASVRTFVYDVILNPVFGDYLGSLVYAILFVVMCWSIGYVLYKKRVYIKI